MLDSKELDEMTKRIPSASDSPYPSISMDDIRATISSALTETGSVPTLSEDAVSSEADADQQYYDEDGFQPDFPETDDPDSMDDADSWLASDASMADSGIYRSYTGDREYRSFDPELASAPEEDWYPYSDADSELDDPEEMQDYEDYEAYEDYEPSFIRRFFRVLGSTLLTIATLLSILYLVVCYTDIPLVKKYRTMYIQTAMLSINHKYLATALLPGDLIEEVMRAQYESDIAGLEGESSWSFGEFSSGDPILENETINNSDELFGQTAPSEAPTSGDLQEEIAVPTPSSRPVIPSVDYTDLRVTDEESFYKVFYEIDRASMEAYIKKKPEVLANGWSGINIDHASIYDEGTSIKTIFGDQVLAINAEKGITLIRIYIGSSRGVLAFGKYTENLSLCAASTLGYVGQTAGNICEANGGTLAITGSAFMDDGEGNGGQISGLAVCSGTVYGAQLGGVDKRLELRIDNRMYIVNSYSEVSGYTRDACEFRPALIVDGQVVVDEDCGWTSPNPRAVLGESANLETMMVVIEGRLLDSPGCSVVPIAELMKQYGCVQALNLDGGTSAIMYYQGDYVTRCSNTALPGGRTLPTAWVYK